MVLAPDTLVSPRQVARAMGVSESSLKRWCDRGLIQMVRTAGGHRKLAIAEVLRYAREQDFELPAPEALGLPAVRGEGPGSRRDSRDRLVDALLQGDESLASQIVFDLYVAHQPLSGIFDDVIAAAFREIGERWACQQTDVYQERRGCEIALRILHNLRRVQPTPTTGWTAIGGTIEGDQYVIANAMAEIVLRDAGFSATSLGTSIPLSSMIRAVETMRPKLFWLSVSHIVPGLDFVEEFAALSRACAAAETALVVGGRALTDDLRPRLSFSAHCDTMRHLSEFAKTLSRSWRSPRQRGKKSAAKPRSHKSRP